MYSVKKHLYLFVSVFVGAVLLLLLLAGRPVAAQSTNLALGATAVASSSENSSFTADRVNDGNLGTRWSSTFQNGEYIYLNFGSPQSVNQVILRWESAYASQYRIQLSNNATNWNTVFTETAGNGGTDTISFSAQSAQYVRVLCDVRATVWGCSLWEFEVYGSSGGTLPSPWQSQDIGSVGAAGSAGYSNGIFTVQGSGVDIWDTADEFRFVYQTLSGNGEIVAQVQSLGNTNPWAKAGVMMRDNLNANARHAFTAVTPGNGLSFQRRVSIGGVSSHTGSSGSAPYWVRLVRDGNTFTAYKRVNSSSNWEQIGSQNISMGSTLYVGLAVTSHNDGTLTSATFANVQVIPQSTNACSVVTNIALNKPAYAWYYQDAARAPQYAVNGTRTGGAGDNRWATPWMPVGWIYVDLGAVARIERVELYWEAAYAVNYVLQTSNDAQNWTTVRSVTGNNSQTNVLNLSPAANGRYLRMYATQRRTFDGGWQYGYSLYEFEIYGCNDNPLVQPAPGPAPLTGTYTMVWNDEFNGTSLDLSKWKYDNNVHVNNEQQQYTSNNVTVSNGTLKLIARYEPTHPSGYDFTSGRLITQGLHEFAYGRFEARIRLPVGPGFWPAFWMLGNNIDQVNWPQCGEIDIMENIGYSNWMSGALHGPGYWGAGSVGNGPINYSSGNSGNWHTYRVDWDPTYIQWYLDGQLIQTAQRANVINERGQWVYDHPHFLILNLALGGEYPAGYNGENGSGSGYFGLPQATVNIIQSNEAASTMEVDWVRVYQRQ